MKYKSILGLNKEQSLIIKSLAVDSKNISQIASEANIPRTSILAHLRKLEKRQIVAKDFHGKRAYWRVNDLDVIERSFYKNLAELKINNSNNHTKILQSSENVQITYHHGVKSIYQIWDEISGLPKHTRIYGIQPDTSFNMAIKNGLAEMSLKKLIEINDRIRKNEIIIEAIVHEKSVETLASIIQEKIGVKGVAEFFESFQGRLTDTVKLPDGFLDTNAEIYIAGSALYIVSWKDLYAITIRDYDLVLLCRGLFDSLKHLCERYDQGAKMAQKVVKLSGR
jgi:sugar-specific transcriptional regulator TrmB